MPALAIGLLLAGCESSSQMRRIEASRRIYETWPLETRQAVLDGKVELDMTPEMVRVALGAPGEVVERMVAGRNEVIWVYTHVETVAPAAPQVAIPSVPVRSAIVNGSSGSTPVALPQLAYRDREIAFFDGFVCRVDRPL
jgi:hypothetical protein